MVADATPIDLADPQDYQDVTSTKDGEQATQ